MDTLESSARTTSQDSTSESVLLPTEMVDYVVDFLHDDMDSLRSCTLVSKQWLPAGSFHLFHCIRWPPCDDQWTWCATHPDTHCKCHLLDDSGTLDGILSLLTTCTRISVNVRSLLIKMEWYGPGAATFSRVTTPQQLSSVLILIPKLVTLEIYSLQFSTTHSVASLPKGCSIQTLRLESLAVDVDFRSLSIFLSHFPSIQTLQVWSTTPLQPSDTAASTAQTLPVHVQDLDISILSRDRTWFDFLSANLDMAALTSLSHYHSSHQDTRTAEYEAYIAAAHGFLRNCSNLRVLKWRSIPTPELRSHPSVCPTLDEIHFTFSSQHIYHAYWNSIAEFLNSRIASAATTAVVDFTYVLLVYSDFEDWNFAAYQNVFREEFGSLDWAALNSAFARLQYLRMEVRLHFSKARLWGETSPSGDVNQRAGPGVWLEQVEECRAATETFIRSRLSMESHQKLELCVSFHVRH
ncbi:hypothetical protein PsYK624_125050 [Phanerochaete sordida]|uniref:F-box domain-containing protein n=1 Tax=Phanerochaete sordida TaxID=48140 RepID=A0A9P3LI95_9APHY|nr:hypothetical protein PsYK624_125050 [Phanerochaete sordida]